MRDGLGGGSHVRLEETTSPERPSKRSSVDQMPEPLKQVKTPAPPPPTPSTTSATTTTTTPSPPQLTISSVSPPASPSASPTVSPSPSPTAATTTAISSSSSSSTLSPKSATLKRHVASTSTTATTTSSFSSSPPTTPIASSNAGVPTRRKTPPSSNSIPNSSASTTTTTTATIQPAVANGSSEKVLRFQAVECEPSSLRSLAQKRGYDEKQLKRWALDAMRKAAISPLCKFVMLIASLLTLAEAVIVAGVLLTPSAFATSSSSKTVNLAVQWGILGLSVVCFLELLRESWSTFKIVSNVQVPFKDTIRALLMPGEVQLELYALIWGIVFLAAYPPLAPLRIWRAMRVFWYLDQFTMSIFLTPQKLANYVVVFLEKIGQEIATRNSRGTWIVIGLYFFTVYVFAVVFRQEAEAYGFDLPENITVNTASADAENNVTCDSLAHCFFTMMRLSMLDSQGFDFITHLDNANLPALVALAILFVTFSAVVVLNGLLGIQRAIITAQVVSEFEKAIEKPVASKETIQNILVYQAEVLEEVFQHIPHSKGESLKFTPHIPSHLSENELARLSQKALTNLKKRGWFFRGLLISYFLICLAEIVLIAIPNTLLAQEFLIAFSTAIFVVITAQWACKIRDMSKNSLMAHASASSSASTTTTFNTLTMGTILMGLLSPGETQLEIACFVIGWVGLYYNAAIASLRVFRIARVLWYLEVSSPENEADETSNGNNKSKSYNTTDNNSRFYVIRKVIFQITQYLQAIGSELFSLKSKGGLVVLGFFFYAAYLFGAVFWLVHSNYPTEFSPNARWWTPGTNHAPCDSLAHCFLTLLRLSLFDAAGFDFLVNMAHSPFPILSVLALIYMCFNSFILFNGMIGIFGNTFAQATRVLPRDSSTSCTQDSDTTLVEPGVVFLMGNGRILRSAETYAFPLPPAEPENEGIHQILEILELERRLEIDLLPKQQILRRWIKEVEVAKNTSIHTFLTLVCGVLSIAESVLVGFPDFFAAQLSILVLSTFFFLLIEYLVVDSALKVCPEIDRKIAIRTLARSPESRLDLFGLVFGWIFFFILPEFAVLRAVRVFRVMWVLQKHPSVRPSVKKIAYLIVNYIEAVWEEFSFRTTNGGIIVLGYWFFITYIFSVVFYSELVDENLSSGFDSRNFLPQPGSAGLRSQWFFLTMRMSLYDSIGFAFLWEVMKLRPEIGVLGFLYVVISSVILLNGLLGIFGGVFAASTNDEAEKDDSEVAELILTKNTSEHIVLREQAKVLQSIQTLLGKLLPSSSFNPNDTLNSGGGGGGLSLDAHSQGAENSSSSSSSNNSSSSSASISSGSGGGGHFSSYEYSLGVFRACERVEFKVVLVLSCLLSISESVLIGFDFKGELRITQIVILALSSVCFLFVTAYINLALREVVTEGRGKLFLISVSSTGSRFELGCLIYGWLCVFLHPPAAPLRCLRIACILWYIKAGSFDFTKNRYMNSFGKLASLGVQYFESVIKEFLSPHTRGGPSMLLLFFFAMYVFACVLFFATASSTSNTLSQGACDSIGHCFQIMLYITLHDTQGFQFLTQLADGPYPALAFLVIMFMIATHFILLNCLIGVFASAFDNRERQQKVNEVEKYEALLQRGFETLSPREEVLDKLKFYIKQDTEAELQKKANLFGDVRMDELKNAFDSVSHGNFRISSKEFARLYRNLTQEVNVSQQMLQEMISEYDPRGEGSIMFTHFLSAMAKHQERLEIRAETTNTFKKYDVDGDGSVSSKELNNCMNEMRMKFNADQLEEILREADINGDGRVDYDEFVEMILG